MKKRMTMVLPLLLLGIIAIASTLAFADAPFPDLPTDHWAYAHVERIASLGLVQGYPDGLFKGGQAMTRYEMAEVVSKLVNYVDENYVSTSPEQDKMIAEMIDELKKEFAAELAAIKQRTTDTEIRLDQHQQTLFNLDNRLDKAEAAINNLGKELVDLELRLQPIPEKTTEPDSKLLERIEELNKTIEQQDRAMRRLYVVIALIAALTFVK